MCVCGGGGGGGGRGCGNFMTGAAFNTNEWGGCPPPAKAMLDPPLYLIDTTRCCVRVCVILVSVSLLLIVLKAGPSQLGEGGGGGGGGGDYGK